MPIPRAVTETLIDSYSCYRSHFVEDIYVFNMYLNKHVGKRDKFCLNMTVILFYNLSAIHGNLHAVSKVNEDCHFIQEFFIKHNSFLLIYVLSQHGVWKKFTIYTHKAHIKD